MRNESGVEKLYSKKGTEMLKKAFVLFFMLIAAIVAGMPGFAEESQKQYTVGVDDVLSISVSGHDDLKTIAPVASDGLISFPYIGRVCVKGMSLPDIEREISQKLADGYIKYPVVSVTLSTSKSLKFFVYGAVKSPGRYLLEDDLTVLKALSAAGGIAPDGLYGDIKIRRKQKDTQEYKEINIALNGAVKEDCANGDMPVQAEDIVVVYQNKSFFVCGSVLKPGKYTLEDNMTVSKAISLAGGITPDGVSGNIKLIRKRKDGQKCVEIEMDLKNTTTEGSSGDPFIESDDKVVVERSNIFFVYGAVTKPGKFVLEDNMTALKAISLAEGFSKYGSPDRVKILRKVMGKEDYESIKVDIKGAISGHVGKDVFLKPDDIVVASEGML